MAEHSCRRRGNQQVRDPGETPDTASINTTFVLQNALPGPVDFVVPGHYEAEASARPLGEAPGQSAEAIPRDDPQFGEIVQHPQELQQQLQSDEARVQALLDRVKQFHRFQLELGEGNRVVRFFTRLPVVQEPDGSYKFSVPREFTQLVTHGDFSVVVLVPRPAQGYDTPPLYNVETLEYSPEANPQVATLAGRQTVAWYWRHDPLLIVRYRYS